MTRRLYAAIVFCIAVAFFASMPVQSADPKDPLAFLKPITGKVWLGHYADSETEHFNHLMKWAPILEGKAIRAEKMVPELDFFMETLFFWDPSAKEVRYMSLTNRGQLSEGAVSQEDGAIVLLGKSHEASGNREYKMTMKILKNGSLEDRFFLKRDGQWHQGHLITYSITNDAGHAGLFD